MDETRVGKMEHYKFINLHYHKKRNVTYFKKYKIFYDKHSFNHLPVSDAMHVTENFMQNRLSQWFFTRLQTFGKNIILPKLYNILL